MNKKAYVINETLEAMLKATASDSENKIVDDLLNGYDGESHEFSQKHKDDMQNLFRLERKMQIYSRAKTYAKRIAVIFIAVIAISTITIASVSAWRIKVMNFIMEMIQQDANITIDQDGLKSNIYKNNGITLNYVPEGFILEKSKSQNKYIYYECSYTYNTSIMEIIGYTGPNLTMLSMDFGSAFSPSISEVNTSAKISSNKRSITFSASFLLKAVLSIQGLPVEIIDFGYHSNSFTRNIFQ